MTALNEIEVAAKAYAEARAELSDIVAIVNQDLALTYARHCKDVRRVLAKVTDKQVKLEQLVEAAPELFQKPRTQVFHGVKVGYRKGSGSLDWENDDEVIRLIRKHFPDLAEVLIHATERPVKKALSELPAADLKRLGITVEDTGDVVLVKCVDGAVEKAVKALLENAAEELREDAA